MIFRETALPDSFIIEMELRADERGFFARCWCQEEFREHGLDTRLLQCNVSFNRFRGTFRGMHYQTAPFEEAKLIRCTAGSIYDVIVDLRPGSPTFRDHFGIALSAENRRMLYVPRGFAHGFLTLEDDSEVFYQMSEYYAPQCAAGFRWDDSAFHITLPREVSVISQRDANFADWSLV